MRVLPYVTLIHTRIPTYGLLGAGGILAGLVLALLCCPRFGLNREDCAYIYVFGGLGAMVGAKLLYLLTELSQLLTDISLLQSTPELFFEKYLSGGMVFYGGLLGAMMGAALSARYFGLRLRDFFPVLVPVFPLIHGVGRIGCFCAGCCYGIPAGWGIAFSVSPIAPNGIPLVPVQLVEAALQFGICLLLLWLARQGMEALSLLGAYFVLYAPGRFFLELLRGDSYRGEWLGLSTSQWISIPVLLLGAVLLLRGRRTR